MATWRYEISLQVLKNILLVRWAHSWNIFSTQEEKFRISAWPCNILYLFHVSILLLFYIWKEEEEISETENASVFDVNATSNNSSPTSPERTEDSEMKQGNNKL